MYLHKYRDCFFCLILLKLAKFIQREATISTNKIIAISSNRSFSILGGTAHVEFDGGSNHKTKVTIAITIENPCHKMWYFFDRVL